MPQKSKGRISIIREGEFIELAPDEQKQVDSIDKAQASRDRRKIRAKLTHKGRPLPEHLRSQIEELDRKANDGAD
jgi:hypothetical protein